MTKPKSFAMWKNKSAFCLFIILLSAALLLSFYGCGESVLEELSSDDTFEAQLEEAKIALDDSDYTRAVDILEAMESQYPDNPEVKQYLSNAYAGLAGLDTYDLLETIDELDEKDQNGSIDIIGTVLGDENGRLSKNDVGEKLSWLDAAIEAMEQTQLSNSDLIVQRGILAISRIDLLIADMVAEQLDTEEVVMTEEGIQDQYDSEDPDFDGIYNDEIAQKLDDDIKAIGNAISAITQLSGSDNDLLENFTTFMNDLDGDGNLQIDQLEIEMYLIDIRNG